MFSNGWTVAPHLGHVSNFCGPMGTLIERSNLQTRSDFRRVGVECRSSSTTGPQLLDTSRTHRLGPQVAQIGLHVPIVALRAHLSECTFANALTLSGLLTSQCSRMCVF